MSDNLPPHGLQHDRLPCPPLSPGVCLNSCSLSWWCYLTISSSATLFFFCLQSFLQASWSFPMSWFFISGSQSIAVLALASVLLMNTQGWFPFSSVQSSCSVVSNSLQPHESQHTRSPYHHLPEFTQTHIHWVGDAIQPSHPLLSPFPSAPNPSQHQSLFQWVNSLHEVGSTNLNSMQSKGLSRVFSNTTIQKLQFFNAQLSLWSNSDIHTWLLE